jgi:CheY-like chemotaxis protein
MSRTLLLADDSQTIQKVVAICLIGENIDIVSTDNGEDAIIKAGAIRPDLILADVAMPRRSGYEVSAALKSHAETSSIPVILLTGAFEPFDEEKFKASGASGYLAKPFDSQALLNMVRRHLPQNTALTGTPAAPAAPAHPAPAVVQIARPVPALQAVTKPTPVPASSMPAPPMTQASAPQAPAQAKPAEPVVSDELSTEDIEAIASASEKILAETAAAAEQPQAEARFTADEMRIMIRRTIREIVEKAAKEIIEEVAWEAVPDMAENIIRAEIKRLLAEEVKK